MGLGFGRESTDNILTLLIAILMFQSIPKLANGIFEKYPILILVIALILLVNKHKIVNALS